jgi:cytochrome c553
VIRHLARRAWVASLALLASVAALAAATSADPGEGIYRRGVTASGTPITASRNGGPRLEGMAVACVNCHQRSGFGVTEGRSSVPPVTGRYLFRQAKDDKDRGLPFVEGMRSDREPYTDATLARAIREGVDAQGKPMSYLMPNYQLGDADMAALIAYLKGVDKRRVPGVTDTTIHFATIITPDADPVKRRGMLDVMNKFFADRNERQMIPTPALQSSARTAYSKSMFMVHRQWQLHVWELTGPAATWQQQLEKHLAREPVFAVLSGLGGRNWAPVHAFCEDAGVPCLFPNVEVPVDRESDFYSTYLSKGLLLEAELMASAMAGPGSAPVPKKVLQVYRADDSGEAGAAALARMLERSGIAVAGHVLAAGPPGTGLAEALRGASSEDALVLWLRPDDLAALGSSIDAPGTVWVSGLMGGLEQAPLPKEWRGRTHLTYPFDLPERRRVRTDFALGWFRIRQIPVVAEQVQADTYLACGLVSETVQHMVGNFVRDYLVERVQYTLEHRIMTGYYPRLSLGAGQRFASKGGYLVRFADPTGRRLIADRPWLVPSGSRVADPTPGPRPPSTGP